MIQFSPKETKGMIQMSFTMPLSNLDISMGLPDMSQDLQGTSGLLWWLLEARQIPKGISDGTRRLS